MHDETMTRYREWQLRLLARTLETDPERFDEILEHGFVAFPSLKEELVLGAVHQGYLDAAHAADFLHLSVERFEEIYEKYLDDHRSIGLVIVRSERGEAILAESKVPVWEIVRAYRKNPSVEALDARFPGISTVEIEASLRFARRHAEEIEAAISQYENSRIATASIF